MHPMIRFLVYASLSLTVFREERARRGESWRTIQAGRDFHLADLSDYS